ncbi:MAG: septal ring lytic transglycosylase RlpA family protein [Alphaproteobacteria bacterium]|nr:septal ring lytic transglycosylase RlpA family protein [Alphaproteobacteria bacterium]MBN2674890.1 septal ring lytic transglycosylase RlpA family protein [Alphaproteobacteria bacterium]
MKKLVSLAVLMALLTACGDYGTAGNKMDGYGSDGFSEETLNTTDDTSLNDAYLLAAAPKYYVGSAYKVEDIQYVPAEDLKYNQTGIAGIIPAELNGSKTSNGEIFDMNQMVATSKTLPLPTIARVTNLDNGTSVIVRVNNRGPFVNTRIMDLSPAVARKLSFNGQTKVQVQVLEDQSIAVKNATLGENAVTEPVEAPVVEAPVAVEPASGDYSIQVGAFYAEDSATALVQKMNTYGNATVVNEGDMYKVRIIGLDAAKARNVIDTLRSNEGMAPGLLKDGKWINADSI